MFQVGRIPMSEAEDSAVNELLKAERLNETGEPISITRTLPGELGELRVQIGERAWTVAEDGTVSDG